MNHKLSKILHILSYDPTNRSLAKAADSPPIKQITKSILEGERFVILTGFPILSANIGESDGPPGAVQIAYALEKINKKCVIVSDKYSDTLIKECCKAIGLHTPVISVPIDDSRFYCEKILEEFDPTHIISIERPSKGSNGLFHNMHGKDISHMVADTDCFFEQEDKKITTISIGDGGNECGMGNFNFIISSSVKNGSQICAASTCDFPLVSGISNWWAWGLCSALSLELEHNLLLPFDAQASLLDAVNKAGGVDGTKGVVANSVDGLDYEDYFGVYKRLWDVVSV